MRNVFALLRSVRRHVSHHLTRALEGVSFFDAHANAATHEKTLTKFRFRTLPVVDTGKLARYLLPLSEEDVLAEDWQWFHAEAKRPEPLFAMRSVSPVVLQASICGLAFFHGEVTSFVRLLSKSTGLQCFVRIVQVTFWCQCLCVRP